jgi:hypothetical protein
VKSAEHRSGSIDRGRRPIRITREFTNDKGVIRRAVITEEPAARPNEEHRTMYRRLLTTPRPPNPAMEPVNRTLNANLNTFVLERLEGLNTPGRYVGLNDLVPVLLRPDLDPQLMATMDRLSDPQIETIADRIRRSEAAWTRPQATGDPLHR